MEKLQGYLTEVLNKLKKVSLLTKDKLNINPLKCPCKIFIVRTKKIQAP
jgi:hypothetical protein